MTPDLTAETDIEPTKQPPSTAGMTTKVVKGSLWTLAGQVAPLAVSLFTTPFVIRMLGAESYGVLILIGLIPTYLGFADFGMSMASTKFASEAYADGDLEKEARIVRTAALIALCSSLPFAIALFALSGWLVTLFNVPRHLLGEASLALKIASVTLVVNFLNGIFNTPQLTRLRMDLNTFVTSAFRILGLLSTPVVLYLGFGIVGAVTVLLAASLLTLAGHLFVSYQLDGHLFEFTFDHSIIRPLLRFGIGLVFLGVAGVILFNLEKGLLSAIVSVRALAYYSVAFTLASMMVVLSNTMTQSLVPAFSQLSTPETRFQLESLFARVVRMSMIGLVPVAAFLLFGAREMIGAWAGSEYAVEGTVPFYVLLAGLIFSVPGYVPYSILMSSGKASVVAKLYWLEIIPYLVLVYILSNRFGIAGTAAAWSIRVAFDGLMFFVLARRSAGLKFKILDGKFAWLLIAVSAYIPMTVILFTSGGVITLLLAGSFLFATLIYICIVWWLILIPEERNWFGSVPNLPLR